MDDEMERQDEPQASEETQEAPAESKPKYKVNPADLPPELRAIYQSMQADYTRKTQRLAEERKKYEQEMAQMRQQMEDLQRQLQGYERWVYDLAQYYAGAAGAPTAPPQPPTQQRGGNGPLTSPAGQTATNLPELNPWDPESVRSYMTALLAERERAYSEYLAQLMRELVALNARNTQAAIAAARLLARDPSVEAHLDSLWQDALTKYGGDLNKAYEAFSKTMSERKSLEEKVKKLEQANKELQKRAQTVAPPAAPAPPVIPQQTLTASLRRSGDMGRYAQLLSQALGGGGTGAVSPPPAVAPPSASTER
jgi:chaperonin cofactor prefoldin